MRSTPSIRRVLPLSACAVVVTLASSACFDVKERTDAGPAQSNAISGHILVAGVAGAHALDADAVRTARAAVNAASPAPDRFASRPMPDVVGRTSVATTKAPGLEWAAGEAIVLFERARFDRAKVPGQLVQMLARAELLDVVATPGRCAGRLFCTVQLRDRAGLPLDLQRTADVALAMHKHRVDGVKAVSRNTIKHGMRVPNDPLAGAQWAFDQMHVPPAWDLQIGNPDLVVAVLDSGVVKANPDLIDRITRDPNNNTFVGMDFVNADLSNDGDGLDLDPEDPGDNLFGAGPGEDSYHGTHVSGIIGANTDNGVAIAGMMWAGRILPVRVLGSGLRGRDSEILEGLLWAVGDPDVDAPPNQRKARVVNMSLGGPTDPQGDLVWQETLSYVLDDPDNKFADVIIVVAAGNEGQDARNIVPANIDRMITVGATRFDGLRADYSNFGAKVDVMAPGGQQQLDQNSDGVGDGILSTWENTTKIEQGTSMSAPYVTGLVGLLVSARPELKQADVEALLKTTSDQRFRCNEGCGNGIVDAVQALVVAGATIEPTARLAVDTQTAFFPTGVVKRDINVLNLGNAAFSFAATIDGAQASLFSVTPTSGEVPAAGRVKLTVNLARGSFSAGAAGLQITGTGAALGQSGAVALTFEDIANRSPRQLEQIEVGAFVRDEDGSLERVGSTIALRSDDFAYTLADLPQNSACTDAENAGASCYEVYAIGDDNLDGRFDRQSESFGAFPLADSVRAVAVAAGQTVEDIDFAVSSQFVVPREGGVGEPCTAATEAADCVGVDFAPGAGCIDTFAGGYCSRVCDEDGICGPGASCEQLECTDEQGQPFECAVCLLRCVSDAQCRFAEGYFCDAFGTCTPQGF